MNTKRINRSVCMFIAATLLVLSFIVLLPTTVAEAEEVSLGMETSASVRIDDPIGLRFTASMGVDQYETIVDAATDMYKEGYRVGMLIAPEEYFDDFSSQKSLSDPLEYFINVKGNYVNLGFNVDQLIFNETSERYEFSGAITDIKESNFNREFSAIAYIEKDNVRTYAARRSEAKNIVSAVTEVVESGLYDISTMDTLAEVCDLTYTSVNVTLPDFTGGETLTVNVVGEDVSFDDVNRVIRSRKGYSVTEYLADGVAADVPEKGSSYIAENIAVDVVFTYLDGTTETIEAAYGVGLLSQPTMRYEGISVIDYDGDFTDLTEPLDVTCTYNRIGTAGSISFEEDGSVTMSENAISNVGILENTPDLSGKGWTAEVNVKTSTITPWQTYGIAVRYGADNWMLIGARLNTRGDVTVQAVVNANLGSYSQYENVEGSARVRKYADSEYLNIKLTYYDGNYYVYFNDCIMDILATSELYGKINDINYVYVADFGEPSGLGFGYRIDDFSSSRNPSLTFSDWSIEVEGDGTWSAPTVTEDDFTVFLGKRNVSTVTKNSDGSYTLSRFISDVKTGKIYGGVSLGRNLAGKNWTVETEVKMSETGPWDCYGFFIKYADGTGMAFGPSVRSKDTDRTQLRLYRWIDALETSADNGYGGKEIAFNTSLVKIYQNPESVETIPVRLTYYNNLYYMYLNDVLCGIYTAEDLGVDAYGTPVAVGFGGMIQDLPVGSPITFSDCSISVDNGDGTFTVSEESPLVGETKSGRWTDNGDETYTLYKDGGSTVGGVLLRDVSGKNWSVEVEYNVSEMTAWSTYGISVKFDNGDYAVIGIRNCIVEGSEKLRISSVKNGSYGNGKTIDFADSAEDVKNSWLNNETVIVKVVYDNGVYYLYVNGSLCRTIQPAELNLDGSGAPVQVGFGVKVDDEMKNGSYLTVIGTEIYVEGESGYVAPQQA